MKSPLAVLYKGPTPEKDVSIGTHDFFSNLYSEYNPISIDWVDVDKFLMGKKELSTRELTQVLITNHYLVIIASHGKYVEDGYIQEIFESNNIRFTGSNSASCRLAMDKSKTQEMVKDIVKVIPTFKSYAALPYPFIAKPNSSGSSIGVYLVTNERDLNKYKDRFTEDYIFQLYIKGKELSLGCVRSANGFLPLSPTEIIPKASFFTYKSKYTKGLCKEITPARIQESMISEIRLTTNKIHSRLGLGYYSRSDYILTSDNELYFLEVNALPGMTKTSLVPQQLAHADLINKFKKGLLNYAINC